jgi:hypothetical protein
MQEKTRKIGGREHRQVAIFASFARYRTPRHAGLTAAGGFGWVNRARIKQLGGAKPPRRSLRE